MPHGTISQYRIIEYLGGGSMGKVYLAEDTLLRRKVALKFLPPELTDEENSSRRFMTEARVTSSLDHDNICSVLQISQTETNEWFIAMRYYEGDTLKKTMGDGPLEPVRALKFALKIARGLLAAHGKDIVHRDIKPANVMVTADDNIKILDFGLARLVNRSRQTRTGTVMGTAAYMSPEQARGEDVGPAADIWALGVVLYEMLSGALPFRGETEIAMIFSILNQDPDPLDVKDCRSAKNCARILERCLEKDPERRYSSAKVLADDLAAVIEEENSTGKTKTHRRPLSVKPRRRRWVAPVVALALAVALTGFVVPGGWDTVRNLVAGSHPPTSITILPFEIAGDEALGVGLSLVVGDRLAELENSAVPLWVIPHEDLGSAFVADREKAVRRLAADYVITGKGSFDGQTIDLEIELFNGSTGATISQRFKDSYGNLKTWQVDLAGWLAAQVDPELPPDLPSDDGVGCTSVPEAFLAYNRGRGELSHQGFEPEVHRAAQERARAGFHQAIAADSSFACAWVGLAESYALDPAFSEEGGDSATLFIDRAEALNPNLPGAQLVAARISLARGNPSVAMDHILKALAVHPNYLPALYALGEIQDVTGRPQEATDTYQRMTRIYSHYPWAYRQAGLHHYNQNEMERAFEYWSEIPRLAPNDPLGYNIMGSALFGQERWTEAGNMFQKALRVDPGSSTYSNLGTIYFYEGRYHDAIESYRQSVALQLVEDPDFEDEYSVYGYMAEAFRWAPGVQDSAGVYYGKALEILQPRLELNPSNPELLVDKASYSIMLGDSIQVRPILEDLAMHPDLEAHTMFTIASIYEELGDRDTALDWLEKSLDKGLSTKLVSVYPNLRNLRATDRYQTMKEEHLTR